VIIEEMKMIGDTPDELLNELFPRRIFPAIPWGGRLKELKRPSRHSKSGHHCGLSFVATRRAIWWSPRRNVAHEQLAELAAKTFAAMAATKTEAESAVAFSPETAAPILIRGQV